MERAASEMIGTAGTVVTAIVTAIETHITAARALPLAAVTDHETVETVTAADGTATMTETGVGALPHAGLALALQSHQRQITDGID